MTGSNDEPRRLATVSNYDDLISALRARVEGLGISQAHVDHLTGWADGMAGKVLGPSRVKRLGPSNAWLLLEALSLRCVLEEDPEMRARMAGRYARRNEKCRRPANTARALGPASISRVAREMGRRGAYKLNAELAHLKDTSKGGKMRWRGVGVKARRAHASRAAKARWQKPKRSPKMTAEAEAPAAKPL